MRSSRLLRATLVALATVVGATASTAASADSGRIRFSIYKAGWIVGGSGGEGTLTFRGRTYPITIGGLSAGLVFGASKTEFVGRVTHIRRPGDVAGVYGAGGAGAAVGHGVNAIVLANEKGAVMELTGKQVGLIANADLSGMAITLR